MRERVLSGMSLIMLLAVITLGPFGIPVGVLVSAIVGLIYGIRKGDKLVVKWSYVALVADMVGILVFYVCLSYSEM